MYSANKFSEWLSKPWNKGGSDFPISGISHDTRTLKPGEVYIAIKGETHDGHDFVEQAVEKGAIGVIVEKDFPTIGKPQLIVPDTLAALHQLAAGARSTWTAPVIGITGSAGKTTVKELVASVLSKKGSVSKTIGNWNNEIGLPLSMLAAHRDADFFVFEIGMSHPGEIGPLAELLRPDWALITNVGKAHIEFFQSLEKIAEEKAAILHHADCAVLDMDSEWFPLFKGHFSGAVCPLTDDSFNIAQPGDYMRTNARFAATLGLQLGLSKQEIQTGLDSFENAPMRWQKVEHKGVALVNDAYNANPLSMRAALSAFSEMPCDGRKIAVLGGMRELGTSSKEEHAELGRFVDGLDFDEVITIGETGAQIVCRSQSGLEKHAAAQLLREVLRAGDMVLFKASRGEKLETIFDELRS